MKNRDRLLCAVVSLCMAGNAMAAQKKFPYQQANLPISVRVSDLLSRMTLEEKVGQLRCTLAWNYYDIQGKKVVPSALFEKEVGQEHVGMLWGTYRADPWTRKSLSNGLNPELAAKAGNAMQKYVMEKSRLGIPLFLAEEAPHGHMAIGTTVFPTGFGMAATWSPMLIEAAGKVIAKEIRLQGGHISYGPVLDLSRDPRWSRVEETMGEDPTLSGEIGAAMVRGLGGGNLSNPYATLATLKHFIGYGTTEGGQNGNPTFLGMREIQENFLPPFKRAIDAGALSVMTSYNSLDGIPCTANDYFLKKVLRQDWKFRGFVVSDLYSIDGIWQTHHVAETRQEAGVMALKAGVDVDLGALAYQPLVDACQKKMVDEALIDSAVAQVLRMKFEMGLFEHPYVDPKQATKEVRTAENMDVAYRVAQAAVTLLENKHNTLPLSKTMRVAVVGPNADNDYNQLGDYTAPQAEGNVKTVLDGIRQKIGVGKVEYVKGCGVRDTVDVHIDEAVAAARRADVVVAVVGGSSARDFKTSYKETGAAVSDSKSLSDMDCGEGFDRATLSLLGRQNELLSALRATGKPLVVVYIEGRPLDKTWSAEHADALLTAYYPGQEGGRAIADVLFGDYNPAGRLPVSVPAAVGQLPVYYNKKAPETHNYVEMSARPLYAFGYGLSYTTFKYSNLAVKSMGNQQFEVSFDVTNTGSRDGEEVAQLYLHDEVASTVQPIKQLKHFERAMIKKGETKHFCFVVDQDDLSIVDRNMQHRVEPGRFDVLVGSSSDNILLKGSIEVKE
ncbi:beta-glucosidase [Prevotella sp. S7 MS 2]|uniref:glycoside hydrolase family 3 N-terminal domain-containing protein n=1 Tax=Prevotella sp. S7 MS 2 TaxID=1287488 RepID=UPI0005140F7E|nr:glycosyl hydrolase family 3 [Prevotella sp. S7 MS 2]